MGKSEWLARLSPSAARSFGGKVSRQHTAEVVGEGRVLLVCDECGKEEWHNVTFTRDDTCLEYAAVQDSDEWEFADDAIVCSAECEKKFWEVY
jgi:hypothetical protein